MVGNAHPTSPRQRPEKRSSKQRVAMGNKKKLLARRRGFTLIELLVAIAILMALAGMAVLFLPRVAENWRAAQGGNMVQTALNIAKTRAVKDRVPRGIRLVMDPANPNYVRQL